MKNFIILLILRYQLFFIQSKIISFTTLPHGDFAFDPKLINNKNGSLELHVASLKAGEIISLQSPDIVFLTTPHGLELSKEYLLYGNQIASGYALLGQDLHSNTSKIYKVKQTIQLDQNITQTIENQLKNKFPLTKIVGFGDSDYIPLRWGEVIPISYLNKTLQKTKFVIMSIPLKRYQQSLEMIPELLSFGQEIGKILEETDKKIAVVVSGDLAHTFQADGPYGYSPDAAPFDEAMGKWIQNFDENELLIEAKKYVQNALSCGYTGYVLMQGMLQNYNKTQFSNYLYANYHPSYYGMMVGQFIRDIDLNLIIQQNQQQKQHIFNK